VALGTLVNSGKAEREADHRKATRIASEHRCLACKADAPSLPAHWPRHRGMGGGQAGWHYTEWVPLCFRCHEILDKRAGIGWDVGYQRSAIIMALTMFIEEWRKRAKEQW